MRKWLVGGMLVAMVCVVGLTLVAAQSGQTGRSVPQQQKPGEREGGERRQEPFSSATFNGLRLRSIGPAVASGRISDFAVHPKNRATYYVAVASGGVWKTENSGTTWRAIFDSQGSYSIGVVRLDPNNPEVVWVGTGENNAQRSVSYGDGVYRSDDGG
ncbi:MAG: WD40/YVTN/BNR-like repeat-containing protein, partial [Candidatus Acidiferrales bacterium]